MSNIHKNQFENYENSLENYEKKAIEAFVLENYLFEHRELIIWWFLYKIKYMRTNSMNIFEFLGIIMKLDNQSTDYKDFYYNQLYFIEADPTKIQEQNLEQNTTILRKQTFREFPYLKTFFPEIVEF